MLWFNFILSLNIIPLCFGVCMVTYVNVFKPSLRASSPFGGYREKLDCSQSPFFREIVEI